jgi:hypothetical protein
VSVPRMYSSLLIPPLPLHTSPCHFSCVLLVTLVSARQGGEASSHLPHQNLFLTLLRVSGYSFPSCT